MINFLWTRYNFEIFKAQRNEIHDDREKSPWYFLTQKYTVLKIKLRKKLQKAK